MITLEKLAQICSILNKYEIKYVLIGGCAVILHGLERTTMDIDVIIENSSENINKLKKAFSPFLKENELNEINPEIIQKYKVIRIGLEGFFVDILTLACDITYDKVKEDMFFEKISDVEIPVAGVNIMLKLKQTFREIDIKDRLFLIGKKEYIQKHKK